jgi:hypothetical protein
MMLKVFAFSALLSFATAFLGGAGRPSMRMHAMSMADSKNILIVGGTRFSGLYLWKELHDRGHKVTLFNRGKTALKKTPRESDEQFKKRTEETRVIKGDRKVKEDLDKLAMEKFDVVYDMNGRGVGDTAPLADMFNGKVEHFIYMSSAGVYTKSPIMPHCEVRQIVFSSYRTYIDCSFIATFVIASHINCLITSHHITSHHITSHHV